MKLLLQSIFLLAIAALFFILSAQPAYADAPGDFKFTVTTEASGSPPLASAKIYIACTGGVMDGIGTTSATGTLFATPTAGSSCANADAIIGYAVETEGMVTYTTLPPNVYTSGDLNAVTTTNMRFQVKVIVADQEGTALTAGSMDTFTLGGSAASSTASDTKYFGKIGSSTSLLVVEDGYVSASTTNPGLTNITTVSTSQLVITFASSTSVGSAITATSTVRGLAFSHIVKALREADSMPIAGLTTVSAGGVTCNEESSNTGTYFCPVLIAGDGGTNDMVLGFDGYVTDATGDTPDRDGHAAAAATTTVSSIDFSHKITIVDELGTALTPNYVVAGSFDGSPEVNCLISSNVAYCAVTAGGDNDVAAGSFRVYKAGYVSSSIELASNRGSSTTVQGAVVMTSANGIKFAVKATLLGNSNTVITGATVTAGDGNGTTCTESGTTGVYYCAVPASDSSRTVKFVKTGFTTRTTDFTTDRTTTTDAQGTVSYNQFNQDQTGSNANAVKITPTVSSIKVGNGSGTVTARE
ncbi:MAG TPA: hypothetical protein VJB68_01880, partial [Methylophilaceae bacterium]|nr:hypothetical protein [Methylophilaceae bacterium]